MRLRYHRAALFVCLLAAAAPVQAQKKDDAPPEPAVAPFDAKTAEEHQKAWAKHLGVRVKLRNSIGMDLMLIPPGEFLMVSPASRRSGILNRCSSSTDWLRSARTRIEPASMVGSSRRSSVLIATNSST